MGAVSRLPTPLVRRDDVIRVCVAFLDKEKVGRVGYVDVDARDPRRVLGVSARPVLDIGIPGSFDDNGQTYLLYNGNSYGQTGFGVAVRKE